MDDDLEVFPDPAAVPALAAGYVSAQGALGINAGQVHAHELYASSIPKVCYPPDLGNLAESLRAMAYVPGPNIDAAYGGPRTEAITFMQRFGGLVNLGKPGKPSTRLVSL